MKRAGPRLEKKPTALRNIPSVDFAVRACGDTGLPRPVLLALVRQELHGYRTGKKPLPAHAPAGVVAALQAAAAALARQRLVPVVNATGICIHTNLGRSPLADQAAKAMYLASRGYCNLEFDLDSGKRGVRAGYLQTALAALANAPAATVVNNCAAALVLIIAASLRPDKKQVVISRGELVQIGGGFRIPEMLEAVGATLREIGTTNQTSLRDYAAAIGPQTALVLRVHRSNFVMRGFVTEPASHDIAAVCKKKRVPFAEDFGSGGSAQISAAPLLREAAAAFMARGPGPRADVVCFSGDKLLGGPQAGIIAGTVQQVERIRRHPLFRAMRCDKATLAALEATVDHHLCGEALESVPVLAMMTLPASALRGRGRRLLKALANLPVEAALKPSVCEVGGGALAGAEVASLALELRHQTIPATQIIARLRDGTPPVVALLAGNRVRLDLRTILPGEEGPVAKALRAACEGPGK